MKKIILLVIISIAILQAQTKEQIEKEIAKYSQKIGFIKGEKKQGLKQKFSMCDEFIDIHWFEKQKGQKYQRGWLRYEIDYEGKKRVVYEVAIINKYGNIHYKGLYFIKKAFSKNWKDVVRDMKILTTDRLASKNEFEYKGKKYSSSEARFYVSGNYLNMCIVKPDNKTALFFHNAYQMKKANKVLSDEEMEYYLKKIHKTYPKLTKKIFEYATPMDINNDGVLDFFFSGYPSAIYSNKDIYFQSYREKYGVLEKKYIFPPLDKTCKVTLDYSYVYVKNNQLYFVDIDESIQHKGSTTICNITQLTTQTIKEEK